MTVFAYMFIVLAVAIALFQLALALGAPLGEYTLAGKFPGKLPGRMRLAAILQMVVLVAFAAMVAAKAEIAFGYLHEISKVGVWFVFAFFVLGTLVNLTSPSKKERMVMGPLNVIALVCSFMVAIIS